MSANQQIRPSFEPLGLLSLLDERWLDTRGLGIPLRPDAPGKPHAEPDRLGPLGVEVDDRSLALEKDERQPELVATAGVDECGQRVLLVIHPVERRAVGAAHPEERAPLVDDEVGRRVSPPAPVTRAGPVEKVPPAPRRPTATRSQAEPYPTRRCRATRSEGCVSRSSWFLLARYEFQTPKVKGELRGRRERRHQGFFLVLLSAAAGE